MFALLAAAAAAEPAPAPVQEEWADGLTARPITSPVVQLDGAAAVLGQQAPVFGRLQLGYGRALGRGLYAGAGLTGAVVHPDSPTGPAFDPRSVGLDLWFTLERGPARHGFGTELQASANPTSGWYLRQPTEAGTRGLAVYDLLWDLGRVDVSVDTRFGLSTVFGPHASAAAAAVVELDPRVAIVAGGEVALAPVATALVGVDVRPVPGFEIDAHVGVPVALVEDASAHPALELQPSLRVKAWF